MDATAGLNPGTVLGGRYRVERCLGAGGMGAVYLVRHVRTDERLALKLLHASILGDAQAAERFRREARAPAQIDSDHVARVVDADVAPELGGAPFLVMEFLRGRDLEHEISARGRLPPAEVVALLGQAARALDKAHAIGIVHRDLKPENLFLATREDGTVCVKVVDFGIAKLVTGGTGAFHTATGSVFGTPMYMAPEQAKGEMHSIGRWTDVWPLGLIAFKLLTGRDYWAFDSLPQLILKILVEPMPAPSALGSGLGPAFDAWFFRCLARPIDQRFASAGEAVAALAHALSVPAPASGPYAVVPAPSTPSMAFHATSAAPAMSAAPYAATQAAQSGPYLPPAPLAPLPPAYPQAPVPLPPLVPLAPYAGTATPVAGGAAQSLRTTAPPTGGPLLLLLGAGAAALALIGAVVAVVLSIRPDPSPSAPSVAHPAPARGGDADGCERSCARFAECTHVTDPRCEANCHDSPIFASCAKGATTCRALSICALGAGCGGRGPAGSKSCRAAADCEGACTLAGGDNTACICACVRAMSPDRATELATANECGAVHCAEACRKPVNGMACLACYEASCRADAAVCKAR